MQTNIFAAPGGNSHDSQPRTCSFQRPSSYLRPSAFAATLSVCTIACLLLAGFSCHSSERSRALSPCDLITTSELQAAVREPLLGPTASDGSPGGSDQNLTSVFGAAAYRKCSYKGATSGMQVSLDSLQFIGAEAAARYYGTLEGMAVRSTAVTHPPVRAGAKALQVTAPGKASTYVLRKDIVLTLEIYQPLYKTDIAQSASLALLANIVDRLR